MHLVAALMQIVAAQEALDQAFHCRLDDRSGACKA
jgi:hypothetical protein